MARVFVDGSYSSKNPDVTGWGYMSEDRTVSKDGKLTGDITSLHQVGGELKATMEAICHFANQGEREITILHDYLGVSEWANGGWRTKNHYTHDYAEYVKSIRAKGIVINFEKIDAADNPADELARKHTGAEYAH